MISNEKCKNGLSSRHWGTLLWQDRCNEKRHTRLFGYVGFAEQDTSPFKVTAALSLEACGLMDSRPQDRMGLGCFYNGLNSDFENLFDLVTPLHDVQGGEVYYDAEIYRFLGTHMNLPSGVAVRVRRHCR